MNTPIVLPVPLSVLAIVVNWLSAALAVGAAYYSWSIFRATGYAGKKWLTIGLAYAAVLRIGIAFQYDLLSDISIFGMVFFWIIVFYALHRLAIETQSIMPRKNGKRR